MTTIEILQKAINNDNLLPVKNYHGNDCIEINEIDSGSKFQKIIIYGINKDKTLLLKFDEANCSFIRRKCSKKSVHFDHMCVRNPSVVYTFYVFCVKSL